MLKRWSFNFRSNYTGPRNLVLQGIEFMVNKADLYIKEWTVQTAFQNEQKCIDTTAKFSYADTNTLTRTCEP